MDGMTATTAHTILVSPFSGALGGLIAWRLGAYPGEPWYVLAVGGAFCAAALAVAAGEAGLIDRAGRNSPGRWLKAKASRRSEARRTEA